MSQKATSITKDNKTTYLPSSLVQVLFLRLFFRHISRVLVDKTILLNGSASLQSLDFHHLHFHILVIFTKWMTFHSTKSTIQAFSPSVFIFTVPSELVEKLVWVPVISLCKIFILSYMFDVLLCRNWPSSPPNRETLNSSI